MTAAADSQQFSHPVQTVGGGEVLGVNKICSESQGTMAKNMSTIRRLALFVVRAIKYEMKEGSFIRSDIAAFIPVMRVFAAAFYVVVRFMKHK